MKKIFIDFGIAPYALVDVCEILFINGITNGFITKEDGDIHIRWEYKSNRKYPIYDELTEYNGQCKSEDIIK